MSAEDEGEYTHTQRNQNLKKLALAQSLRNPPTSWGGEKASLTPEICGVAPTTTATGQGPLSLQRCWVAVGA